MKPVFQTNKTSGINSIKLVKSFNGCKAFVLTGGEVAFVSNDYYETHLKFNLNIDTKNYHNTGFGGAIYSSLDPIYPLQLHHILGDAFVIWDIAATINYLKPVTKNVYAKFLLEENIISKIKQDVLEKNRSIITLPVKYTNEDETIIYAEATKTIYIADRKYFNKKNPNI